MDTFAAPGAGMWELDRSHFPGGTTPIAQWLMQGLPEAMRGVFAEFGMPADTLDVAFVHGFMYTRLRPMLKPDSSATKLPPTPVLKLASRLHPAFRARNKSATRTLANRPWRQVVADWETTTKPRVEARNLQFQAVELDTLSDGELADHLAELLAWCRETYRLHFHLHGFDLGPIGMLLYDCKRWGIERTSILPALAGASPSTTGPANQLHALRGLIDAAGAAPASLADVRSVSAEAAALLDAYLRRRGTMLVTRYDVDGQTLAERPETVLASILHATPPRTEVERGREVAAAVRAQVPEAERALFDERLTEAREAMDLRDDNGPFTAEWPVGLLRLALLALGRRMVERGSLLSAEHGFELYPEEVEPLARGHAGPDGATLQARAHERARQATLTPPDRLGPLEPSPPLEALPVPIRTLIGAVESVLELLGMASTADSNTQPTGASPSVKPALRGSGVGSASYRGTARVAHSPEAALDEIDPGDVLVVRFTTPAYNTVLGLAGAVVTADGGPLSHAAVMARELGIPAVIGAAGAMDHIRNGDEVEVDPVGGRVTVLGPAA